MNNTTQRLRFIAAPLVVSLALATQLSWAQEVVLPPEKTSGSVTYVTGGIPDAQAVAFKNAARSYPLNIELYQKAGAKSEYTADADVVVTDRSGRTVLEAKADGPFLYAKVGPGTYRVKATLAGKTVEKSVTVGKGTARAVLVFPQGTD